jgi:hypothetical protein
MNQEICLRTASRCHNLEAIRKLVRRRTLNSIPLSLPLEKLAPDRFLLNWVQPA